MIERGELALLRQFDADGHLALSLYIDLSTSERRDEAIQRVTAALAPHFQENNGYGAEQAEALREDLDMVRLYFKTSNSSRAPYIAIFSCAPQLFWRVYQLDVPIEEAIIVGHRFELAPLEAALERASATGGSGTASAFS
ncbi:MAG: hypothetical protein ACUVWR_15465 [Anaerolineae bacterium]